MMCLRYGNKIRKWKLTLLMGGLLAFVAIRVISNILKPAVVPLCEIEKCPACYGRSICDKIQNGYIKIRPFGMYSAIAHLIGSKNVFFGTMGDNIKIVLKKLAHSYELRAFDDMICNNATLAGICPRRKDKKTQYTNVDFHALVVEAVTTSFSVPDASSLRLCPTAQRIDKLLENIYLDEADYNKDLYQWTLINVNPEPLVLQILPASKGWPVPEYLGACGRITVQEYVGFPLTTYYYEPWIRRAKIASSLLAAARMFTFRDPNFGFYLTDLSPDNIAVTADDQAKFIDLENIIIVDKNISAKDQSPAMWRQTQVNRETIECRNCLAFSPADICNHRLSDHNYYAICQHILSDRTSATSFPGGFLHGVPKNVMEKYTYLINLLDQCALPIFLPYKRISFGDKLKQTLDKIVKDTG